MISGLWLMSVLFHYFLKCHLQLKNLHKFIILKINIMAYIITKWKCPCFLPDFYIREYLLSKMNDRCTVYVTSTLPLVHGTSVNTISFA